ncbi:MAG: hypothetical protein GF398_14760 [Chitinivibrionales bacterium]|nr:hypothetical protein [Chitinivibrionales bacterium]
MSKHWISAGVRFAVLIGALFTCTYSMQPLDEHARRQLTLDTLSGPLPKLIKHRKLPYVVAADIEVPANRSVTIEPGVVLVFKNFTGLHVQGQLIAEGTPAKPIVFTSEYDGEHNPASIEYANPYDWNGIYIHGGGIGSRFKDCFVLYSVYGIVTETKFVRLDPVIFMSNGKSDFVVETEKKETGNGPFRYVLSTKDATVDGVSVKLLEDPLAPRRNLFRYSGLAATIVGLGVGTLYLTQIKPAQDNLNNYSTTDADNLTNHSGADWHNARKHRNATVTMTTLGGIVGLMGATAFGWSFTF